MDDHLKVLDGYMEFDEPGKLSRICGRGRSDLQGWSCMSAAIKDWPDVAHTQLDSKGRIVRRQLFRFDKDRFVTCSYDDSSRPHTSKCTDDVWIQEYSYDKSGRALSYRRRHTRSPDEAAEQARLSQRVVDLAVRYVYTDDKNGNWTELRVVYETSSAIKSKDLILRRNIEYY
jgi:hypothetical protein